MAPTLEVCLEALDNESELWEENVPTATAVMNSAEALRLGGLELGFFGSIRASHDAVCDFVREAGRRAAEELQAVSDALMENKRAYEDTDADISESVPTGY